MTIPALRSAAVMFAAFALSACSSDGAVVAQESQRIQEISVSFSDNRMLNIVFEYDESGRLLRSNESIDGVLSEISDYETQANGRIISRSDDSDADGTPEHIFNYEYEEGLGLVQINVFEIAGQQFIDAIRYTYENGLIASRDFFDIADVQDEASIDLNTATMTSSQAYTYEGTQLLTISFLDEEGTVRSVRDHAYNPDGTLATTTTTSVNGGTNNSSTNVYENGPCFSEGTISTNSYFCVR